MSRTGRFPGPVSQRAKAAVAKMFAGKTYLEAAKETGLRDSTCDKLYWRWVVPAQLRAEIDALTNARKGKVIPTLTELSTRAARLQALVDQLHKDVERLRKERDAWKAEAETRAGMPLVGVVE